MSQYKNFNAHYARPGESKCSGINNKFVFKEMSWTMVHDNNPKTKYKVFE